MTVRRALMRLEAQTLVTVERRPGLVLRVVCGGVE
jgi:DNA-binding GntR family transcriptional regulator